MDGIIYALILVVLFWLAKFLLERQPSPAVIDYQEYLKTPEWRERSRDCKARAGWRCSRCGSRKDLQAHHLTYARLGQERPGDLECLCDTCHRGEHGLN